MEFLQSGSSEHPPGTQEQQEQQQQQEQQEPARTPQLLLLSPLQGRFPRRLDALDSCGVLPLPESQVAALPEVPVRSRQVLTVQIPALPVVAEKSEHQRTS